MNQTLLACLKQASTLHARQCVQKHGACALAHAYFSPAPTRTASRSAVYGPGVKGQAVLPAAASPASPAPAAAAAHRASGKCGGASATGRSGGCCARRVSAATAAARSSRAPALHRHLIDCSDVCMWLVYAQTFHAPCAAAQVDPRAVQRQQPPPPAPCARPASADCSQRTCMNRGAAGLNLWPSSHASQRADCWPGRAPSG